MTHAQPLPPVVGAHSPTVAYASIGSRFGAYFVDALAALVVVLPGYVFLLAISFELGMLLLLASPAFAVYQWYLVATRGHTVGKRMVGIRVVDEASGQPIGWGRAFLRQLVLGLLAGLSCGILGLISILTASSNPRRQAWHDSAASTVVIVDSGPSAAVAKPATSPPPVPPTDRGQTASPLTNRPSLASGSVVSQAPMAAAPSPTGLIQSVPGFASPLPPVVPPPVLAPPAPEQPPAVIDSEIDHATRASIRRAPREQWQLRGEDGTQIGLSGPVLLGRAPEAGEHPGARAVAVADPERSMSKTHALFAIDGARLEVEDWSSTNGTSVTRDGQERELAPRVRTPLEPGDQVTLGDRVFIVESIG